jgi:hypothetical protein
MRSHATAWITGIACLISLALVNEHARADETPQFEDFVEPLRVEAGPLISPAVGPLPRSQVWGAAGVLYRSFERGRAKYSGVGARLVLGGEWSPEKLDRLGLGGSLVAFQMNHDHVDLPPVIDERTAMYDLGPLRLLARMIAFRDRAGPLQLAITPYFRLGLPSDTSRTRQHRRVPIRRVIDDRVIEAPYLLIEPGVSMGGTLGPVSIYTHQAPVLAPIHGVELHFFWAGHFGTGIRIDDVFEIAAEISGLMRATDDYRERKLSAWSFDPGMRLHTGALEWEIAARIGISDQAQQPFGHVTAGIAVCWVPEKAE